MTPEVRERRAAELKLGGITPMKLAHIVLKTSRFADMVSWYKTVLQLRPAFEALDQGLSFLTFDDEHHRIAIAAMPGLGDQDKGAAGIEHIAFTYRSLGQLLGNYLRLKDCGILPVWSINHGPTMSLYYVDPDGNQLELMVDNFATLQSTDEYLLTDFVINPIGTEFDPDELVTRYLDGESFAELTFRPDIGARSVTDPIPMPPVRKTASADA